MLNKSSKTPKGKLLSLFDVLQDWTNAPNLSQEMDATNGENSDKNDHSALTAYLAKQAKACGAQEPSLLADHLILIAINATKQQLAHADSQSLMHAKKAAHALILSQTQQRRILGQSPSLALAASLFLLVIVSASQWSFFAAQYQDLAPKIVTAFAEITDSNTEKTPKNPHITQVALTEKDGLSAAITAADAVKMYAKYEQMRQGTCQYLEVLQIPDKHKAIYIENVVGSKLPTNLNDLAIANFYLEKVRCNFTPMLMANSK